MERGVSKEGDPPDPNYVHLHLEIFLPDILKSSGLGGGGLPRTQPEKANLSAEEGGKEMGGNHCWTKTPGREHLRSYLL